MRIVTKLIYQKRAIEALKVQNGELSAQLKTAQDTLTTANKEIDGFKTMDIDAIKLAAADWEKKAKDAETNAAQQLDAVKYDYAVEAYANGLKFTSDLARRAYIAELKAKKLTLDSGKLLGAEDFTKSMREQNPTAFEQEQKGGLGFTETTPPDTGGKSNARINQLIRGVSQNKGA